MSPHCAVLLNRGLRANFMFDFNVDDNGDTCDPVVLAEFMVMWDLFVLPAAKKAGMTPENLLLKIRTMNGWGYMQHSKSDAEILRRIAMHTHITYFVLGVGTDKVKIGRTQNLDMRMQALRCASPVPLELLATVTLDGELEHRLHKHFYKIRAHGEWFKKTEALEEMILLAATGNLRAIVEKVKVPAYFTEKIGFPLKELQKQ